METDVMARAPSIPSMGPSVVAPASTTSSLYSYPTQQQQHQPSLQHFPYMDTDPSLQQEQESPQSQFPPTAFPFEMENASGTSLVDYASRAGGSSSMLSGITAASDSAPTTPGSQQYHNHQLHLIHPYDSSITTPSTSTTALSLMEPTTTSLPPTSVGDNNNSSHLLNNNLQQAMIDEYGRPMNMFIPPYYDPSSHQQQQDSKWYSNPLPPSHHQQQPW
ncbi:hypothetical protein BDA99DRAFT_226287 [Phascolomyces articulosus]|uniref:Uncharacterized protein n=1 Tax=Phascolomyces articulosus TaxID=60185 RepID=A0AAD5JQG5_9FUNG|nr:hypothetical protein BDA99DRAFT_226287 [Phascolomyces articulosus]